MQLISNLLIGFIALEHLGFMVLEMFFWQKPVGRRIFGTTQEQADSSAALAKNQGLYNGFLAVGLLWGLFSTNPALSLPLKFFFLGCVLVAGIYGSLTASRSILFVQALPALLALITLVFSLFLG